MDSFAHVVGWPALVKAARPALEKGCFSWVRIEVAEATIKSPTRQIDRNLTSTFQKATVERVLGALANVIGLCGEEEAGVVVLSSGLMLTVETGAAAAADDWASFRLEKSLRLGGGGIRAL